MVALIPLLALALVAGSLVENATGAATLSPATLTRHFYKKTNTCADVEVFVRHQVTTFWNNDKTITPKLLRLLYSDCMVTVRCLRMPLFDSLYFFLRPYILNFAEVKQLLVDNEPYSPLVIDFLYSQKLNIRRCLGKINTR